MLLIINIIAAVVVVGLVLWSLLDSEKAPHRGIVIASIAFIVGLAIFGNFFLESRKLKVQGEEEYLVILKEYIQNKEI